VPADLDTPACLDTQHQRDLVFALGAVPDPRRRRGVRYRLASLLAVRAVLAGASMFAAIGDWAADLDPPACARRNRCRESQAVGPRLHPKAHGR
jgi:hypothetical protein